MLWKTSASLAILVVLISASVLYMPPVLTQRARYFGRSVACVGGTPLAGVDAFVVLVGCRAPVCPIGDPALLTSEVEFSPARGGCCPC